MRTVLGSCVAICLWDKRLKYGAMSHFVQPVTKDPTLATARYGNVAVSASVRMMDDAGCRREDLQAQILGGAILEGTGESATGQKNVRIAKAILSRKKVRIVSEDVGGTMGRKVIFHVGTGEVVVFKVHKIRDSDWDSA